MADSYREWQPLRSPAWMQAPLDPDAQAWEAEMGGAKDLLQLQIRQGVTLRFPDFAVELGAPDALESTGADRNLPRGYLQTDQQFADRIRGAWDVWPGTVAAPGGSGSHAGMLRELKMQGFWPAMIVQDNGRYTTLDTLDALVVGWLSESVVRGRPGWRFVDRSDFWSRFAIVFPGPLPPRILVTARATFSGTSEAQAVWSQPWDDADYRFASSAPVVTSGGPPALAVAGALTTPEALTVMATADWTGYVDFIGYRAGGNPFASPSLSTLVALREIARLWKPANMTYDGAIAIVQGGVWDWPVGVWDEVGDVWDINSAVKLT